MHTCRSQFDRELNESNDYVTKLTMLTSLFTSRFISVMIRAIFLMMLYTDWFYLFNTVFSGLELVLGLERLSLASSSASKI